MSDFKQDIHCKASLMAQMIVHIYKENMLPSRNAKINETVEFIKNGSKHLGYNDKCMKFKEKTKFYYFDTDTRKTIVKKVNPSFELKKSVLNMYKSKTTSSENTKELVSKLAENEKTGEIRPTFDLWNKILWFLPHNALLLLFEHYENLYEEAMKTRTKMRKYAMKEKTNMTLIHEGGIENAVYDVKNVTIYNDVVFLCENLVPLLEKELPVVTSVSTPIVKPITLPEKKEVIQQTEILDSWEDFC